MSKPTDKRSRRRSALTRARILRAAMRLADKDGIEQLSMRKLAQALGVQAMSIYNHVANKEQLLSDLVDHVVGEIEVPAVGDDWKLAMRRRAISAHEMLRRHPWALRLIVSGINVGPGMLRYFDATLGCLRDAGFSYAIADRAMNAIDSHVYGFALQELNFPFEPSEYAAAASEFLPMIPAATHPHMRALAEQVITGEHDGLQVFTFGLDLLLAGLERLQK